MFFVALNYSTLHSTIHLRKKKKKIAPSIFCENMLLKA